MRRVGKGLALVGAMVASAATVAAIVGALAYGWPQGFILWWLACVIGLGAARLWRMVWPRPPDMG